MSPRLSRLLTATFSRVGPYAVVALIGLVVLLPKLGAYGLWDPWEPRYPQAVREMLDRDTIVVPWYRGELRYDKPILAYWGIMAGRAFFGLNEFGARIGGVALSLAALLSVTYGVGQIRGRRAGLLAGLAVAIMPQFYLLARQITSDVYMITTIGPALLFFALALSRSERRTLHFVFSAVAFGLAILAKGPIIAGALLFATFAIWVAMQFDPRWFLRSPHAIWTDARPVLRQVALQSLLYIVVVGVVAAPWHVALVIEQGWEFFDVFIIGHNFDRALKEVYLQGSSEFYFGPFLFGFLPWCVMLPATIGCIGRWRGRELMGGFGFEVFLLASVAVTFAAFSYSITKYTHYVSPALIPFGALAGITLDRLIDMRGEPAARLAWMIGALLFMPVMVDVMAIGVEGAGGQGLRENGTALLLHVFTVKGSVPDAYDPGDLFRVGLIGMWCCMVASAIVPSRTLVWLLIACGALFAHQNVSKVIPELTAEGSKTMKGLCESWYENRSADEPIAFNGPIKHGAFFYTNGEIERIENRGRFLDFMNPANGVRFAIVAKDRFGSLNSRFRSTYGGAELHIIDASHDDYELVVNVRTGGEERGIGGDGVSESGDVERSGAEGGSDSGGFEIDADGGVIDKDAGVYIKKP